MIWAIGWEEQNPCIDHFQVDDFKDSFKLDITKPLTPTIMKKLLSLFLLCSLGSFLYAGEYPDISVKELQKAIKDGKVTVIDVNGAKSFKRGHIPTAIDFSSQGKNLGKLLPKDKNQLVVAYCGGPGCGAYRRGADAAAKLGFKNVKHLSAGISGWKKSGAPIEN